MEALNPVLFWTTFAVAITGSVGIGLLLFGMLVNRNSIWAHPDRIELKMVVLVIVTIAAYVVVLAMTNFGRYSPTSNALVRFVCVTVPIVTFVGTVQAMREHRYRKKRHRK